MANSTRTKVGEIRPSQLLFAFGVGAVIELRHLSTIVMGLDDWDVAHAREIGEERLLAAVRAYLSAPVTTLRLPPQEPPAASMVAEALRPSAPVGIPVAPFPHWMLCPRCRLLTDLRSGLLDLRRDSRHPDRTRYEHGNCNKAIKPTVLPARFLVACERGHLDDFPWLRFVHHDRDDCPGRLRLYEPGIAGEAADVSVHCEECGAHRRMSDALGEADRAWRPRCRGRWPHLRDYAADGCDQDMRAILLGASNSWFPIVLSALSVPSTTNRLAQLVEEHWALLGKATSLEIIAFLRQTGQLSAFAAYSDEAVWDAIEARRSADAGTAPAATSLRGPEWELFAHPDPSLDTADFRLRPVGAPTAYATLLEQVVLVERLREVRALVGFTRIESPGDFDALGDVPPDRRAPLSRRPPTWLPAVEVRGEGLFIQFAEEAIQAWLGRGDAVEQRKRDFFEAYRGWRFARGLDSPLDQYPGIRYVLLHSFAHALIRQLALACGYAMASLRERIYARPPDADDGPMAGVLLYTAAPDSEGTLGGLVSLGEPLTLQRHVVQALEQAGLCASDPLCADHHPYQQGTTLHGAACYACLFLPETSCERGNKYLDRWVLAGTIAERRAAFFST